MAKRSNMPLIVGLGVAGAGAAYLLYRRSHPVVDAVEKRTSGLTDAAKAACMAAAMASGIPGPLATLSCAAGGEVAKGAAKAAKAVGRGVVKGAKAVGRAGKAVGRAGKKVGQIGYKVGKAAVMLSPPVLTAKIAIKGGKEVYKAGKKVVKATKKPVAAAKKVAGWLGLSDLDLASYAAGSFVKRKRPRSKFRTPRLSGLSGCAGGRSCCQTLRSQMSGYQFYEQGLSNYRGL